MLLDPLAVAQMLKRILKMQMPHLVPIKIKLFDGIKTIESAVHQEPGEKRMIDLFHVNVFNSQTFELSYKLSHT